MNKSNLITGSFIAGFTLLMSACAAPKPGAYLDVAGNSVRAAEIAGADTYAPQELFVAEQHIQRARLLIANNRQDRARKLLQLAIAQADLARAISEAEHAEAAMRQLQSANNS